MKRRSNAADETVSLFPFLAVLLCTMGTLALIFAIASQNIAPNGESADATATKRGETSNALDAEHAAALEAFEAGAEGQTGPHCDDTGTPKASVGSGESLWRFREAPPVPNPPRHI